MVRRIIARSWLFRGLMFAIAIGCWLSFVPSSRADGPVLVPPAPPAADLPTIPAAPNEPIAESSDLDGPVLPYPIVDTPAVKMPTPSLDESSRQPRLPSLQTPVVGQKKPSSNVPSTTLKPIHDSQDRSDKESGFVTVRSRKRKKSSFSGKPPRLETAPDIRLPTLNPLLVPETPSGESPNDPYPIREGNVDVDPPMLTPVPSGDDSPRSTTPAEFSRVLEKIVLSAVPSRHTDDDQWGKKKTVTAGVKVGMKGLFLRAKRTTKEVDHGTWKKFEIDRKSSATPYTVKVSKLKMINDRQFQFSAEYLIPVTTQSHLRDYSRGIRLRSMNVDGQAIVQLKVDCTVDFESVSGATAADERSVILYPVVNSAQLKLAEFNPAKGSRFKGSTGRELGRDTQRIVEEQLSKRQPGLTASLNSQFDQYGLQMPLNDLLETKWGRMLAGSTDVDE